MRARLKAEAITRRKTEQRTTRCYLSHITLSGHDVHTDSQFLNTQVTFLLVIQSATPTLQPVSQQYGKLPSLQFSSQVSVLSPVYNVKTKLYRHYYSPDVLCDRNAWFNYPKRRPWPHGVAEQVLSRIHAPRRNKH
jgi:hypothetical protein